MANQSSRRDFLRQGVSIGAGLVCCCVNCLYAQQSQPQKTENSEKKQSPETSSPDFSKMTYCCHICNEKCKSFAAAKKYEREKKPKKAKKRSKPRGALCYGCKAENNRVAQSAINCTVRKCARKRKVITCAHCDDFPTCKKDLWTSWPKQKKKVEKVRKELKSKPPEKKPEKKEQVKQTPEDFSKFAYCSLECNEKNCKVFRATKNEDLQAKAKIAKKWSEKYGRQFKPEDVACYGCKTENAPISQFAKLCTVRKCAKGKKVITCAHCDDFPACDKKLWTKYPKLREKTNEIRSKLQVKSKT